MSDVVSNFDAVGSYIDSLSVSVYLSKWLSKALKKEAVTRRDWLKASSIEMSSDEHVLRAIENGNDIFEISFCDTMKSEIRHVMDWLAELEQRDPRLFAKLDRITWKQSVEHSARWHEAFARKSEKVKGESIPFDENCPVMYTHDDGMKWVWLKTDKARDDEGRIMGHCVGSGGYDDLGYHSGVFSLRDIDGRPHVTLELLKNFIGQAMMKRNIEITDKYRSHVDEFHRFMIPKLTVTPNKEGIEHLILWNGDEEWYCNGRRHREDGPAIRKNQKQEWYFDDYLHREDGPAIIWVDGMEEWFLNGKRHREDGPARIWASKSKQWWVNGIHHRDDGPATVCADGQKEWWVDGRLHREGGPAVELSNGCVEWWLDGKRYSEKEYLEAIVDLSSSKEFFS